MAIQVADNFSYKGGKPLDARSKYATLAAMKAAAEADLYDGCMAYVDADGKYYSFNSANTVDATTGKWRVFESGGGASDLADLGDVNLTSPANGQVLKYDATNDEWVNDDESGGGGSGHEILDNGNAMTARAGLNFVDFDISDDSTDDETEVSAHRLTSAEMDEIMGTLPGTPTELPVLFDETGAERVVGWYVTSAGKKPVYERTCDMGSYKAVSNNNWFDSGVSYIGMNIEALLGGTSGYGINTAAGDSLNTPLCITMYDNNGYFKLMDTRNNASTVIRYFTIRYTKTTDTFA